MKYKVIFFIWLNLLCLISYSATYYVSPSGNDSNNGTSISTPWKTINKVNSAQLFAGDNVFFERNGKFRGFLQINNSGSVANPINIGAYGNGEKPIFLGSELVTNWVQHQGNIWKTQISGRVFHLICNNELMTLARYPNTGWLRNDLGTQTKIQDAQLTQPSGYWNGSTVVVRSTSWSYDTSLVTSYTTGTLNFTQFAYGYNLESYEWGYFIRNKFTELDAENEWFYDKVTQTLYFYKGTNPNTLNIEIIKTSGGYDASGVILNWQVSNVTVSNIDFRNYGYAGVNIVGNNNITIDGCIFDLCVKGIRSYGSSTKIKNNLFTRTHHTAYQNIAGPDFGNNNLIERNIIRDCGLFPGLGESSWGYFGMKVSGSGNIIRLNKIENVGYIGIDFDGDNNLVEKNFIDRACSILNDGSGISFDKTNNSFVQDNIVINTIGFIGSCAPDFTGCDPKGKGIYFGNVNIRNMTVQRNTVANCAGPGIWLDNTMVSSNNIVRFNTLFNNQLYQFGVSDYSNYNGPNATPPYSVSQYNHIIEDNIFYSLNANQMSMYHINAWFSGVDFGTFNRNKYVNPWNLSNIRIWQLLTPSTIDYTLSQWKSIRGDDLNSTPGPLTPSTAGLPENHILLYNNRESDSTFTLSSGTWGDLDGNLYNNSIVVNSFKSKILFKTTQSPLPMLRLNIKILLSGPLNSGSMVDSLRRKNLLPLLDPYPNLGYSHILGGGQSTTQTVFNIVGNSAIVDWVIIELRSSTTPGTRLYSRSALLQRDGDVVDMDGVSPISINLPFGQYYVVIKHRNHLGVMTAIPYTITSTPITIDFTTISTYGVNAQNTIGQIKAMRCGDVNFDNLIKYSGPLNDRDDILFLIGGVVPTNTVSGYLNEDINLDGIVKYTGQNNDRDIILTNIGGVVLTNTIIGQIP